MIRMNWGTKIVLGLASFMTFIVAMGVIMVSSKKDALVDNDYYEKGINYDKDYNRKEQVSRDHARPVIQVTSDLLVLTFRQNSTGTIRLMRTADKNLDRNIPFHTNPANQAVIPVSVLPRGSWRLIADWNSDQKSYLYESEINLKSATDE